MKIRQKILAGYLVVLVVLFITLAIGLTNMRKVQQTYTALIDQRVSMAGETRDFLMAYEYEALMMRTYFLTGNQDYAQEYLAQAQKAGEILLGIEKKLQTDQEKAIFNKLYDAVYTYNSNYAGPMMAVRSRSDLNEQQKMGEITRLTLEQKGTVRGVIRLGEDFAAYQQTLLDDTFRANEAWVNRVTVATALMGILALLISIAAAFYLGRLISEPLKALEREAMLIAGGDFTPRKLATGTRDEVGSLSRSFSIMQEQLRNLAERMNYSANVVATYTRELQSSTYNASEAANATSARMSRLSETMRRMVDGTAAAISASDRTLASLSRAEETSEKFSRQMETSFAVVNRAGRAVRELEETLLNVGGVIDFISQVADQANLLARKAITEVTNMSSEGSAFLSLAAEIQKRAQEAANATRDITNVIVKAQANTRQAIDSLEEDQSTITGTYNAAREASAALKTIVSDLKEMAGQVQEMVDFARQVSDSVHSVTDASEKQTGLVEGFAVATATLNHVAGELQSTVASLKL